MSIFGKIKDAIFGTKAVAAPAPSAAQAAATTAPVSAPATPTPVAPVTVSEIDVLANLEALAQTNGQNLNWKSSIVDLMKLLGLDPSLHNREELAGELGYNGPLGGSAEMNIWLHKAVMRELARNGGKVPAELTD